MAYKDASKGKVDFSIGNGWRYTIISMGVIALISLLDFDGVSLEGMQVLVAKISIQLSDTIAHLVQARTAPGRAALTVTIALLLAWLGFFYFLYSIPVERMRDMYLRKRKVWNYIGLVMSCIFFQLMSSTFLHMPALRELNARPVGPMGQKMDFLIQTDVGLGMVTVVLLTLTAYLYATLLKTIYAHLTHVNG
ncbi:hypothetical protein N5J43_24850 [Pseudomonas nicosulfuronedens]|uniref:hypothetical protein n=1 Tax=Pseudomonas nicosulfuronedens TaxID=2571105 RepID=UPI00244A2CB6|nr:hypothetical protein [Pseudomonas nicosulfuronedens]MDH1012932.1 hypothetical protein [Pseudomonas nicosulfuronedens]MDH1982196.1 hypothetical protein [Pseudomonas nicosulfuronedens]MDH2030691.1 hypothetical protein [Pseudomonas nicosulfuronedens]